ncbi:MAG: hypothetical protein GY822_19975 [Deltaproteobacteria bacterium]|nr:hypothetical protein [Deltaproteobacteria bacterium]
MFILNLARQLLLGKVPMRQRTNGFMQATVATAIVLVASSANASNASSKSIVEDTLINAASEQGMRVEIESMRLTLKKSCHVDNASLPRVLNVSSQVSVSLRGIRSKGHRKGRPCQGMAIVKLRVFQEVALTDGVIERGESLAGHVQYREMERLSGVSVLTEIPKNAVAARRLEAQTRLAPGHMMPGGPQPGTAVNVAIVTGGLQVSTRGVATRCRRRQGTKDYINGCARLPSGKVVQGRLDGRQIVVESF